MENAIKEIEKEISGLESELTLVEGQILKAHKNDLPSFNKHKADILEDLEEARNELDLIKKQASE